MGIRACTVDHLIHTLKILLMIGKFPLSTNILDEKNTLTLVYGSLFKMRGLLEVGS